MIYLALLLILLPFIQLGFSYYLSVAGFGALFLLVTSGKNFVSLFERNIALRVMAAAAMLVATSLYAGAETEDILRTAREAVFFFLITGCVSWKLNNFRPRRALDLVLVVCGALFVLVFVQFIYLRNGVYFGLPPEYYSQNAGTIPGVLDLIYSHIRPAGTFGEPSYLGGVCLGLLFACTPALASLPRAKLVLLILLAIVILSSSLSAILTFGLYLTYYHARHSKHPGNYLLLVVLLGCVTAVLFVTDSPIASRLSDLGSERDASAMDRFILPLQIIPSVLSENPLGVPFLKFAVTSIVDFGAIGLRLLHNGLLNAIINYGIFGIFVVYVFLSSALNGYMRFYLLFISMQNGAIFSIDKFFVISLCVMLHNSFRLALRPNRRLVPSNADHDHFSARSQGALR
ncbi:hypothetical protein ACVWZK_007935 [Bradyrhizobium sp. GM0.4]